MSPTVRFATSVVVAALVLRPTPEAAAQAPTASLREAGVHETERARVRLEVVADSLRVPSAIAFLPDGSALVAERAGGRVSVLDLNTLARTTVEGLPPVYAQGDGGMLDVLTHPDRADP